MFIPWKGLCGRSSGAITFSHQLVLPSCDRSTKGKHEEEKDKVTQNEKDWRIALATAVQPFLFENAAKFVEELERFIVSGLDITAFDDLEKQ